MPPCHDCVIAAFAEFLFLEAFLLARTAASSLNDIRDISCCNRALSKGSEKGGGSIRGMNLVLKIEEEETSFLFSESRYRTSSTGSVLLRSSLFNIWK